MIRWLPSLVATVCGTLTVLAFSQRHAAQRPIAIAATANAMDRYECVTFLRSPTSFLRGILLMPWAFCDDNRFCCRGVQCRALFRTIARTGRTGFPTRQS